MSRLPIEFGLPLLRYVFSGLVLLSAAFCFAQPTGQIDAHDPSTVVNAGGTSYYFSTGQGIISRTSTNGVNWANGAAVFATHPAWINTFVPGFEGVFWAPDVVFRNNQYYMYYSASIWGTKTSGIGVATSPTLDPSAPNYGWTDQGSIVTSNGGSIFNAIDPSILQASTGRMWMAFGSFNNGIFVTELDSTTGKRIPTSPLVNVANHSEIEAAALIERDGYYYMLVNWGGCCSGTDSGYEIHVGRSTSPTGPFLDRNGVNMLTGAGSLFYDDDGARIGPGHFALTNIGGQDKFSYHYYDGNRDGAPTFGLSNLYWTADDWPSVAPINPDWTGAASGMWSVGGNWGAGGGVPSGVGSVANFVSNSAGRYAVTVDGPRTVSRINFRGNSSYTIGSTTGSTLTLAKMTGDAASTLNVAAGSHTIAAPLTTADELGVNVTPASGALTLGGTLTAGSLQKYGSGLLTLGGASTLPGFATAHAGTLHITGSLTTGANLTAGQIVGDEAAIIVSGNGVVNVGRDLNVGDSGSTTTAATGTLTIRDNAAVTVGTGGAFVVGSGFFANSDAVGTVHHQGGTLTANGNFDGAFVIGGRGSNSGMGTYNLSGGTVNANTNVRVGGFGTGTIQQTGGVFTSNSYVAIGRLTGSTGVWNISGGQLNVNNSSRWLLVGEQGAGTLNISGTGQVTTANVMRVGHNAGSGVISLNGGGLTTLGIQRGSGTATLNFNGGVLSPNANSATFLQGLTAARVQIGGARINTSGFNITVGQALLHDPALGGTPDGGLTKSGLGTLTMSGASTYTGQTTVSAGVLALTGSVAGPVVVNTGATLQGTGTVGGATTIENGGALVPGTGGVGILRMGSLALATGAVTRLQLAGLTLGTQFDRIETTGLAQLGGTLEVTLLSGFVPNVGDSFGIVFGGGGFSGAFATLNLPTLGAGKQWALSPGGATLVLSVASSQLLGDYNADGTVDAADYTVYRDHLGTNFAMPNDATPGAVTEADYTVWQTNFGPGAGSASPSTTSVPEPSAFAGLLGGVLLGIANRKRKIRQLLGK